MSSAEGESFCRCGAALLDAIAPDGSDTRACSGGCVELLHVRELDVVLVLPHRAQPNDPPPCPRCHAPCSDGTCAACGYPATKVALKPWAARREAARQRLAARRGLAL